MRKNEILFMARERGMSPFCREKGEEVFGVRRERSNTLREWGKIQVPFLLSWEKVNGQREERYARCGKKGNPLFHSKKGKNVGLPKKKSGGVVAAV